MKTTAVMTERLEQGQWVAILGGLVNIFLGVLKFIFGILGNSTALIADSLHSFSDLLTDGLVYVAMRYGSHDADAEHPYGHGRIETAATMLLAIMVATVGGGIAYEGLLRTLHPAVTNPAWYTLVIALCSIVIK